MFVLYLLLWYSWWGGEVYSKGMSQASDGVGGGYRKGMPQASASAIFWIVIIME